MRRELPPKIQVWDEIRESAECSVRKEQEVNTDVLVGTGLTEKGRFSGCKSICYD